MSRRGLRQILVVGAGGMGSLFVGLLTENELDLTLVIARRELTILISTKRILELIYSHSSKRPKFRPRQIKQAFQ